MSKTGGIGSHLSREAVSDLPVADGRGLDVSEADDRQPADTDGVHDGSAPRSTVPIVLTESASARWLAAIRGVGAAGVAVAHDRDEAVQAGAGVLVVGDDEPGSASRIGEWLRGSPANGAVLVSASGPGSRPAQRQPLGIEVTGPTPTPEELVTRISMVQFRVARARLRIELRDGWVDLAAATVCRGGERTPLTAIEVGIVIYLAERAGQIVSPDHLLERVLGYRPGVRTRALHYAILRLRRKLEVDPSRPALVQTIRGRGYRWSLGPPSARPPVAPLAGVPLLGILGVGQALVGREAELPELMARLARDRLIVLTGPAGVGKTRLAAELATVYARGIAGSRVLFVRCEAERTRQDVASALIRSLGGGLLEREPPDTTVNALLARGGPLCVILDDVAVGDADVAEFVASIPGVAPSVAVIATSHLGISTRLNAFRNRLSPLAPSAARQMFWHCISRVRASAQYEPDVDAAVQRIVELSDGLPLCIELSAARARLVPLRTLVERLVADPGALESTDARIPGHHRSLVRNMTVAWDALSSSAQAVLRHVSVFRGGFDAAAAQTVCRPPVGNVGDALAELVAANLLAVESTVAKRQRYGLLGVVRRFVTGHLGTRADIACAARHARYYARVGRGLCTEAIRVGRGPAVDELVTETENLVVAMRHALQHAPHVATALVLPVLRAFTCQRQWPRWRALLLEWEPQWSALPAACRLPFEFRRAAAAVRLSEDDARERLLRCAELARTLNRPEIYLSSTFYAFYTGAPFDADSLRTLAAEARAAALPVLEAEACQLLAMFADREGDKIGARDALWRARCLADLDGDAGKRAWGRIVWANHLIDDLRMREAAEELEECMALIPVWSYSVGMAVILRAVVDIELGHLDRARQRLVDYLERDHPVNPNQAAGVFARFYLVVIRHLRGDGAGIADEYVQLRASRPTHAEPHWTSTVDMLIAIAQIEFGTSVASRRAIERARSAIDGAKRFERATLELCELFVAAMAARAAAPKPAALSMACARAVGRIPGVGDVITSTLLRMVARVVDRRWLNSSRG